MLDAVVIGAGFAGTAAALRLREAGRSVRVVAAGGGATGLSTGVVGPDPDLSPADMDAFDRAVPGFFLRAAGPGPMRVPTTAGSILHALAAPAGSLDLGRAPGPRIAIASPSISGAPTATDLARLLGAAAGPSFAFVGVETPLFGERDDAHLSPGEVVAKLRAEPGAAASFGERLGGAIGAASAAAALLPSFFPASILPAISRAAGRPAFRLVGTYGLAQAGLELAGALEAAIVASGAEFVAAHVEAVERRGDVWVVRPAGGGEIEARAVVVATGGPAGGGVVKRGRIAFDPPLGVPVRAMGRPLAQESAPFGPAADAFLPPGLFGSGGAIAGVAVDESMRVAGAPAGLFAAGAIAARPGRSSDGLAWALASGSTAGRSASSTG